jgi:hypothetical protein
MIPTFYQTHLKKQLTSAQFLVMTTLLSVMQSEKQARLERLARVFPYPITTESRRRKLQRFLDLPSLTISLIWFPLITYWLTTYCRIGTRLSRESTAVGGALISLWLARSVRKEQFHYTGRCCQN